MWTKKSSLNIKQGPQDKREEGEKVFAGAFKCMQIAVQPI